MHRGYIYLTRFKWLEPGQTTPKESLKKRVEKVGGGGSDVCVGICEGSCINTF